MKNLTIYYLCLSSVILLGCHVVPVVKYKAEEKIITIPIVQPSETGGGETAQTIVFPADVTKDISISYNTKNKGTVIAESASQKQGALIFYFIAGIAGIIAICLIAFKHFKLASLAAFAAVGFTTLGVTLGRYPQVYAYLAGMVIITFVFYIGYFLWQDYKDDGLINLSTRQK